MQKWVSLRLVTVRGNTVEFYQEHQHQVVLDMDHSTTLSMLLTKVNEQDYGTRLLSIKEIFKQHEI